MKHNIHIFFENILRKNAVFKKNYISANYGDMVVVFLVLQFLW